MLWAYSKDSGEKIELVVRPETFSLTVNGWFGGGNCRRVHSDDLLDIFLCDMLLGSCGSVAQIQLNIYKGLLTGDLEILAIDPIDSRKEREPTIAG